MVILEKKEDLLMKWKFREENKIFKKYACPIFGGLCRLGKKCNQENIPENSIGCAWSDKGETFNNIYDEDYQKLDYVFDNLINDTDCFSIFQLGALTSHDYLEIYEVIKDHPN
jgi:hypothetical protein